ncbi:pentatricopeptide repeat-containing protein At1g02370, mitochondrial-like isoform X1 [Punica granatum]|uniref:Pentatricopeptide repeat-containing protein At1g02370, mitochondrial-like isoform X1 n=2 Tax=Punica granatum TaxID=22663 RepID=A0A6P8EDG2_PUNGR|nr:pentatricopeptide repeat-containing protein At1g02370, mitochondrial-like isoform X1 [Punica granatum]
MGTGRPVATKLLQLWQRGTAAKPAADSLSEMPRPLIKNLAAAGATGGSVWGTSNVRALEGKRVGKPEPVNIITDLWKEREYDDALQVSSSPKLKVTGRMENRNIPFSFQDHATHMRLVRISKVEGVAAAENYFHNLPASAKNKYAYGALLHCYCKGIMKDKALLLLKEMEGLGFVCSAWPYNRIMSMYMRIRKPEKILSLVEEMKRQNISLDLFTYNMWMQSYACLDDVEGAERVYHEMIEHNDASLHNWTIYSSLASIYVKAGLTEKAESALKKLESVMKPNEQEAYYHLITLYAGLRNLGEVHRVWASLKAAFRINTNFSYYIMLSTLRRLKDFKGLKTVFEEWRSSCLNYDDKLVMIALSAYLGQDRLEEAEALLTDASEKAKRPFFRGMELFMVYFLRKGQVNQCMEFLKAAVFMSKNGEWTPKGRTINVFLMHFKGRGDVDTANELFNLWKDVGGLKGIAYRLLLNTYAAAGKTDPEMRRMLEQDGIEMDDELEKLLGKVCPSS